MPKWLNLKEGLEPKPRSQDWSSSVGSFTSFGAFGRLALELNRFVRVESGKPKLGCPRLGVLLFAS